MTIEAEINPVSRDIPAGLSVLGEELASPLPDLPANSAASLRSQQAHNYLESANNTLKRIFEKASEIGDLLIQRGLYAGGKFLEGAKSQFDEELKNAGKSVVKWIKRFLFAGVGFGGLKSVGFFANLAAEFPEIFGWLERFVPFLNWLT